MQCTALSLSSGHGLVTIVENINYYLVTKHIVHIRLIHQIYMNNSGDLRHGAGFYIVGLIDKSTDWQKLSFCS